MHTPCPHPKIRVKGVAAAALCLIVLGGCVANGQERTASLNEVQAPLQGAALQARVEEQRVEREARSRALRDLVGSQAGSYLFAERSLYEQINLAMGIPDSGDGSAKRERELHGGFKLYSGCRQHSCREKGAVLMSDDGHAVRAALISFKCQTSCGKEPILTIFKRASDVSDPADAMLDDLIKDWAQSKSPGVRSEVFELR